LKSHALVLLPALLIAGSVAAGPRKPRLPDLHPVPAGLNNRRIVVEGGRRLMRFDTIIENSGAGPVEVRGRRNRQTDVMEAYQAIYLDRKLRRFKLHRIGEFEWHEEHRHWHLLQVAEYRLKNNAGEEVTTGTKISFCFVDTHHSSPNLPGSPSVQRYVRCSNDVNDNHFKAGISVGWSDVYNLGLFGQWVDITDVPTGSYQLEVEIDPLNLIQEQDETNNIVQADVFIPAPE
jgi:hypothetical protein